MKYAEALTIVKQRPKDAPPFEVTLVCGFTPLHISTFTQAYLQKSLPSRLVEITTGTYGDLAGTLEAAAHSSAQATAVVIEWPDLDPRLGYRQFGGWGPEQAADVVQTTKQSLDRIARAVAALPAANRIAISLPTLAPAPMFSTPGWQASQFELAMLRDVFEFAESSAGLANVRVANPRRPGNELPIQDRFDFRSELFGNLPYTLAHADSVAEVLSRLIAPPAPKKGLITDLDDTLWHGILGDVGPEGVSWDLASHHSVHGLYQQLLRALADEGVLLAVASKNDEAAVEAVFDRSRLLLPRSKVYPVEAHWSPKSGSVERILAQWNISADSVVFVDDSPMEIEEVRQAHPEMECLLFPKSNPAAAHNLFRLIRDLFGKSRVTAEDALRLDSIRKGASLRQAAQDGGGASDEFLRSMQAVVTLEFQTDSSDERVLELVNKTNQFNLNGLRFQPADWSRQLAQPGAFLLAVSYSDRFGPLGKIAALQGTWSGGALCVHAWVLSCRAFARRIEHVTLKALFEHFPARKIGFSFASTAKNTPLREFFRGFIGETPTGEFELSREVFERACPALDHTVATLKPEEVHG